MVTVMTGHCPLCGKPSALEVEPLLVSGVVAWLSMPSNTRPFVQTAFPNLSAGDREQLVTGCHEACFDETFGGDEE
jgi:hypothetical protein